MADEKKKGAFETEKEVLGLSADSPSLVLPPGLAKRSGSKLDRTYVTKNTGETQVITSKAETSITSFDGISFPGNPDGVKKYALSYTILWVLGLRGATVDFRVRMGQLGNKEDPVIHLVSQRSASSEEVINIVRLELIPKDGDKITLSLTGRGVQIRGGATSGNFSWMEIIEIS